MRVHFALVPALILSFPLAASAATYKIDTAHSSVNFKIRHLVSKVAGNFGKFDGQLEYEKGKPEAWRVDAVIDAASINTANKKRDDHLRSEDFFDVKKYPKIAFKSTGVEDADDNKAKLKGLLTMHGVTKPVEMDLEIGGEAIDPWGNKKVGFTATTKVNRKDFGIVWNKTLDAGSLMLGDEVEINLEVEADQLAPAAVAEAAPGNKAAGKKAKK